MLAPTSTLDEDDVVHIMSLPELGRVAFGSCRQSRLFHQLIKIVCITATAFGQTIPQAGRGPILFPVRDQGRSRPRRRTARPVGNCSLCLETKSSPALHVFLFAGG